MRTVRVNRRALFISLIIGAGVLVLTANHLRTSFGSSTFSFTSENANVPRDALARRRAEQAMSGDKVQNVVSAARDENEAPKADAREENAVEEKKAAQLVVGMLVLMLGRVFCQNILFCLVRIATLTMRATVTNCRFDIASFKAENNPFLSNL